MQKAERKRPFSAFCLLPTAFWPLSFNSAGNQRFPNAISAFISVTRRLLVDQLNVEAQRLKLAHQHVKRFRQARIKVSLTLDDSLVNLGTSGYVVRLRSQQLLKNVSCAIGFQRPNFHFPKSLSAELRLAAQRLLRNQAVWPNRTSVNLVIDQVRKLEHVDVTDSHFLLERIAGQSVIQDCLA